MIHGRLLRLYKNKRNCQVQTQTNFFIRQNFKRNAHLFKSIQRELKHILSENTMIEHIGSTSIKRMWGKNIIDIAIGVQNEAEVEKVAQQLEKHRFFRGRNHASGAYIFLASRQSETKSGDIHLHVVPRQSDAFYDFLSVRAYFRANPKAVSDYIAYKRFAVHEAQNNRARYKAIKSIFMAKIVKEARDFKHLSSKSL